MSWTRLPHYIGSLSGRSDFDVRVLTPLYHKSNAPNLRAAFFTLIGIENALGLTLTASSSLYSAFIEKIVKEFPMATQVDPGWRPTAVGFILLIGMALLDISDSRKIVGKGRSGSWSDDYFSPFDRHPSHTASIQPVFYLHTSGAGSCCRSESAIVGPSYFVRPPKPLTYLLCQTSGNPHSTG